MEKELIPVQTDEKKSNSIILSWEAPEFIHHDKDVKWYILASLFLISLLGYSIYTKDWFFIGALIFIVAGTYGYLKTPPKIRRYTIAEMGIYIDDKYFSYDSLHSFWIIYEEKVKTLNFVFNKKYLPAITIQIESQNPLQLKEIFKKHLPEQEKRTENFGDKLVRRLKF